MSPAAVLLGALVLSAGAGGLGYWRGLGDAKAAHDAQALADLTDLVATHRGLIAESRQASSAMRRAVARRGLADDKTTKELRDALERSAASRAGCVFPDDVVRQLAAARDRAAQAAAGGVRGALPAPAGGAEER